jgi:uncharacterized DUF497 family protein
MNKKESGKSIQPEVDNVYTENYNSHIGFLWDQKKNEWLKANRGISFEEVTDNILERSYIKIIENPARKGQKCFIMNINSYTWIVPFIIDNSEHIILKTAFPSRKYHKLYGGLNHETD